MASFWRLRPMDPMRSMRSTHWLPWSSAISMTDAIGAAVLSGVAASPGLAVGPIALQQGQRIERRKVGRPDEERNVLSAALAAAAMQLTALGEAAHDDVAAEILEFQLALLDDEELIGPIVEA